jgi:ATP-dependent Lon protease
VFFRDRKEAERGKTLPLLPLRDLVVFPHMVVPLIVGRPKSRAALSAAFKGNKELFLVAQRSGRVSEPGPEDMYEVGCVATIVQLLRLPDDNLKVLVEGKTRARIERFVDGAEFLQVELSSAEEVLDDNSEAAALIRSVREAFEQYVKLNKGIPPEMLLTVTNIEDPAKLADTLVAHLQFKLEDRQELLELGAPADRLEISCSSSRARSRFSRSRRRSSLGSKSRWSARRRSTTSTSRCRRSRKSWVKRTSSAQSSRSLRSRCAARS